MQHETGKNIESIGNGVAEAADSEAGFRGRHKARLTFFTEDGHSRLTFTTGEKLLEFGVNPLAHQQISARLGIPLKYYQRMQMEAPALLDENVNNWLQQSPERRMLRVMDGNIRAFLSARYRRLDNLELCAAVLPIIRDMKGAVVESCEVTEAHLYLKVINKKMKAEVSVNDVVQAGFVISNSEVGLGHLTVEPLSIVSSAKTA